MKIQEALERVMRMAKIHHGEYFGDLEPEDTIAIEVLETWLEQNGLHKPINAKNDC